jgi:hypothetical protein
MAEQTTIHDLQQQLLAALQTPNIDFGKILDYSNRLARLDPDNVRFSVDAGLINRLGRELVAKQETAVSELIKNAYDADATLVELLFEASDASGGTLTIFDNGHGMSRDQLINGFMRLSSTDKIHNPISPRYRRMRAGRKGIGRFAAQRLGSHLIITTQTEDSETAFRVSINWKDFADDHELFEIANQIEETPKTSVHGTTLVIQDLQEPWTDAEIRRVYRYVVDLIQPFPLSVQSQDRRADPGFDTKMYRDTGEKIETVASAEKIIYEYALAEIEAFVDNIGQRAWSISSDQLEINEQLLQLETDPDAPRSDYASLRNVNLRAYYYIYNAGFIPRNQNRLIGELAKERGGIRVYRNGFRVLPYGRTVR